MSEFAPSTSPAADGIPVCFQITTKGGAVIDTEAERYPDIQTATMRAGEWMKLPPGESLTLITYEGDGGVVRIDEIEHIAVLPETKMAALYVTYRYEAEKMRAEIAAMQEEEGTTK